MSGSATLGWPAFPLVVLMLAKLKALWWLPLGLTELALTTCDGNGLGMGSGMKAVTLLWIGPRGAVLELVEDSPAPITLGGAMCARFDPSVVVGT